MTEPTVTTTTELPFEERVQKLIDAAVPYFGVCTNDTKVILDPKKIYGYYQRTIFVENPISNISVSNNVWLRHGDLCRLTIKFTGTAPFNYCTKISSNNNASLEAPQDSDECSGWKPSDINEINYGHFFSKDSNSYSLVVYIKNEVSLTRTPIGVQFYEGMDSILVEILKTVFPFFLAQEHSQLSVVIVPVVFSLVAVVLIVFGVAYYVQNRNQFMIEVADFNFGETQSIDSLEYKSFFQRLLDSISDLFIRHNYNDDPDMSPAGEPSTRNYSHFA